MALDVIRYLNNEPIQARPPSRLYRLQKLVRRNRAVFVGGTAVALALIAGFGTSTWLYFREREARQEQVRLRNVADNALANEMQLRQQRERREHITQAAFLLSRNQMEAADLLMTGVNEVQPSLEAETVLRRLGEWHAMHGEWNQSTELFNQLLQADQGDKSESITSDLLMAGPILIERGDTQGYEHFRRAAIARFAGTTNVIDAERTLKISLLLPPNEEVMKLLEPFDRTAAESFEKHGVNGGSTQVMAAWRCISLALMAYRQNYTPTAKEWCRKCLAFPIKTPARIATAHIIRAMACWQLGELEDYRSELAEGRKLVETQLNTGLAPGTGIEGWWFDWLFARVLLREAEALSDKSKPSS
jgi:hypothetical protein